MMTSEEAIELTTSEAQKLREEKRKFWKSYDTLLGCLVRISKDNLSEGQTAKQAALETLQYLGYAELKNQIDYEE